MCDQGGKRLRRAFDVCLRVLRLTTETDGFLAQLLAIDKAVT